MRAFSSNCRGNRGLDGLLCPSSDKSGVVQISHHNLHSGIDMPVNIIGILHGEHANLHNDVLVSQTTRNPPIA